MMKRVVLASVALLLAACAPATEEKVAKPASAPDEDAILAVVDGFFLAMAQKDADALDTMTAPGAKMIALGYGPDGAAPPRRGAAAGFIDSMRADDYPIAHEAYWSPTVLQRADLAVVWAPYYIDIDGERLHCGVDVFNMSRENGAWLIDSLSFTMEPAACEEIKPDEGAIVRPDFSVLDAKEK